MGAAEGLARSVGSAVVIHSNLFLVYQKNCDLQARKRLGGAGYFRGGPPQGPRSLNFDAAIAYALLERQPGTPTPAGDGSPRLTKRERQVAGLIAEGLTNQAIADRLVISPRTAQGHVEHILAKLGFTSRTQVAAWVVEQAPRLAVPSTPLAGGAKLVRVQATPDSVLLSEMDRASAAFADHRACAADYLRRLLLTA